MNDKEAIALAKTYIGDIYAEEKINSVRLEEFEHMLSAGKWIVALSFSRPSDTPRTRAQEVLENLGAASPIQRSFKVVTISEDGTVLSVKNRPDQVEDDAFMQALDDPPPPGPKLKALMRRKPAWVR